MRIGIDMRMAGTGEGIGRYCEELIRHLGELDRENEYILLVNKFSIFKLQFSNFKQVVVRSKYYSLAEQTYFIRELARLNLDLMHFTNFNFPIFYPGKFVVTIHDLIHHQFPGRKKSRYVYRVAYRTVVWTAVHRAEKIIAVSEATKKEIVRTFGIAADKVRVIYEGLSSALRNPADPVEILRRRNITKPFLLYVGVWRQYKNLPRLAEAFDILKQRYGIDCQLVLAGKIDTFYPEIRQAVFMIKHHSDLRAIGPVSDEELAALYKHARFLVLPSFVEGFGLTGIEAQSFGLPVAASDIPVLREVLQDGAIYFDPKSAESMAREVAAAWTDDGMIEQLRDRGLANAKRFDWKTCAAQTLNLYEQAL